MSQSTLSQQIPDPSWVLEPITEIGVRHALILSADGIVVGASGSLGRDESEGMAAMVSALHGAARAAAVVSLEAPEETPISTVTVQLDGCGTLMVMPMRRSQRVHRRFLRHRGADEHRRAHPGTSGEEPR